MDNQSLQRLVIKLAGPAKDRSRLARMLGITESTAYGWIVLSEQDRFALDTSVRGEQNKAAKQVLIETLQEIDAGRLSLEAAEEFVRDTVARSLPQVEPESRADHDGDWGQDEFRKAMLKKGLAHATTQLDRGVPVDAVIAAVETVLAMSKDGP